MSESKDETKSLVETKQSHRRSNFNSHRRNAPITVLSTISSVGAEEDEACMTDIEDPDDDQKLRSNAQKSGARDKENGADPASSSESRPTSTSNFFSTVRTILGNKQSSANRSSQEASMNRSSSGSSTGYLGTISEIPNLQKEVPQEASPPHKAPRISSNQLGISNISSSPNLKHQSLASTLVGTPSLSDVIEKAPTVSESHLSTTSEKKTGYSSPRNASRTSNRTYSGGVSTSDGVSTDLNSRFSWHVSNTDKAKSFFTKWFINWWLFEIICWLVSAILMAIILAVLAHYDGKTIPQWHVGMTLNAFVSVLSGFSRAALLLPVAEALGQLKWTWFAKKPKPMYDFEILDGASRGPLGSFVLLAHFKGITLASIGAAVILLTIPLDLFFQQIVAYPTVWVKTDQVAHLARGIYYNNAAVLSDFWEVGVNYQDIPLYGIISSHLLQTPLPVFLPTRCPSSNCTWPTFDTLGFCSQCADLSSNKSVIQYGCFESGNDWIPFVTPSFVLKNSTNITACGYYFNPPEMNQPPILISGYQSNDDDSIGPLLVARHISTTFFETEQFIIPGGSLNFKDIQNPVMNFIISNTPGGRQAVLDKVAPIVQECSISWCVKTISANFYNGVYNETILETTQLNTNNANQPWTLSSYAEDQPYNGDYDPHFSLTRPDPFATTGGQSTYGASNITARAIILSFGDFAPASWGYLDNATETDLEVKFGWEYGVYDSPPMQYKVPQSPWEGVDINTTIHSLGDSMTNAIRQYSVNNSGVFATIPGESYNSEVHVQLRLEWAALPGGLLLFSLIFLISTVLRTSDASKIGVWKTSALAVLFNGIGEDVQAQLGDNIKIGDARKMAKKMEVQLEE